MKRGYGALVVVALLLVVLLWVGFSPAAIAADVRERIGIDSRVDSYFYNGADWVVLAFHDN